MSQAVVCDASVLVAALLDGGPDGEWATRQLRGASLAAPAIAPFEAANVMRRHELAQAITHDQAEQAHADLLDLDIELWPHQALSRRSWALRANLSIYDAGYVALAELLDCPLVTLDRRMARAPEIRCSIVVPQ